MGVNKSKLLKEYKWVQKEWDFEQNHNLDLETVLVSSGKRAKWICQNNRNHKWEVIIANRTKGTSCPYCAGKKVLYKESFGYRRNDLLTEWHYKKNETSPFTLSICSNKKVWWICKIGLEWEATVNSRSGGTDCPYCSRQRVTKESSLLVTHPKLAKEWNYSKNKGLSPDSIFYGTQKSYWWISSKGHEWNASPNNRSRGRNLFRC